MAILRHYDSPQTLFYLDPPYVASIRVERCIYQHEHSDIQYQTLLETLLAMQGKALLCGYYSKLYEPLEQAGWQRHKFKRLCTAHGGHVAKRTNVYGLVPTLKRISSMTKTRTKLKIIG